jgi:hypothetical protein
MIITRYTDMPESCADGYVRLDLAAFLRLPFENRRAWEDLQLREDLATENIAALRAGYCEWASNAGGAVVSLGWVWYEDPSRREMRVASEGISSNVMLLDQGGSDLGCRKTASLLQAWLLSQPWQQDIVALGIPASWPSSRH